MLSSQFWPAAPIARRSALLLISVTAAAASAEPPTADNAERMQWVARCQARIVHPLGTSKRFRAKKSVGPAIGHPHDGIGHESLPPEVYDNLYQWFSPVKFNADQWMQLAKTRA